MRGVQRRCVWAVGRLGVAACVTAAAAVDRQARQSCLLMWRCELSRPDSQTSAFCVAVRPAVALRRPTHAAPYTTRRSCLCRVWCELDDCSQRAQTSNYFLSATVLSCLWESSSHHRGGRDTDKTVLSCLVWRCELDADLRHRCCSDIVCRRCPRWSQTRAQTTHTSTTHRHTYTHSPRSTQPCIPPGSLNRVPASAGVTAGMSPLPGDR